MEEKEPNNIFSIKLINNRNYKINTINQMYFTQAKLDLINKMNHQMNNSFENNDDVDSYSGDSDFLKVEDDADFVPPESDIK